jgi:hypothetical protein
MSQKMAPAWGVIIETLRAAGMTLQDIGNATAGQLNDRMLLHYCSGVQPLYWRGEIMVRLWCERTGKAREQIPMAPVHMHYRRAGRKDYRSTPNITINLPDWPKAVPVEASPLKRGPGRPKKLQPVGA